MDASIVIANWNGAEFIGKCLASVEATLGDRRRRRQECGAERDEEIEVLVVDDASEDYSPSMIEERFPDVRLIRNETNKGFATTVNRGLREARGELVVLLNNDIVLRADFLSNILAPFDSDDAEDLFAVSAKTLEWTTGGPNHVRMNALWRRGRAVLVWDDPDDIRPALFAQGGACAVRRSMAAELRGLRTLYHPGYWEDYDLSYRAAKRGWRSVYAPGAVAYHLGRASFDRRYGRDGVDALRQRNELLFHWSNLDDPRMIASHAFGLAWRVTAGVARGDFLPLKATIKAIGRWPAVARARRSRSRPAVRDAELLR